MGGPSAEHEVSLHTGKQIIAHLDQNRYLATPVIITKTCQWLMPFSTKKISKTGEAVVLPQALALKEVTEQGVDVAFIALHGKYGEDGTIQGLLEALRIPYTGSKVLASALGMDKPRSLSVFRDRGLCVPAFRVIYKNELKRKMGELQRELIKEFSLPLVVKPSDHGSSIGISIVRNAGDLPNAMRDAFRYSPEIMIQRFIDGRELTCGIIEKENGKLLSLPLIEIIPKLGKFYDYKSKYDDGGSDHLIPPPDMPKSILQRVQTAAALAHRAIGCAGMSRSDFILGKDGKLYILEINTIPGMTSTSLLPHAASAIGIHFPKLVDMLIKNALKKTRTHLE